MITEFSTKTPLKVGAVGIAIPAEAGISASGSSVDDEAQAELTSVNRKRNGCSWQSATFPPLEQGTLIAAAFYVLSQTWNKPSVSTSYKIQDLCLVWIAGNNLG